MKLNQNLKLLLFEKFHIYLNSQILPFFIKSIKDFIINYLIISTKYNQYKNNLIIKRNEINMTLNFLNKRYYKIIYYNKKINKINKLRNKEEEGEEGEEEEEEEELEKIIENIIKDEIKDEKYEKELIILQENETKEEEIEEESEESQEENEDEEESENDDDNETNDNDESEDEIVIDLTAPNNELNFKSISYNPDNIIPVQSFYELLLSCWNTNISPSISINAFEALYSILEHHIELNMQGSPRYILFLSFLLILLLLSFHHHHTSSHNISFSYSLFEIDYLGSKLSFGLICRLLNEQELNKLLLNEYKYYQIINRTVHEQKELNNLLKAMLTIFYIYFFFLIFFCLYIYRTY